ncbi:hypothetical protein [Streptomyces nigrescens]|uniref:hypothetical protein n=1 Tax=Streptomyces nigrescens TaxID=1920 RepID=UPI002250CEE8|nr:hypothetical protein [Streptomyces libani]MCX5449863.1 hypothetical protein [Streptomyces libani]
MKGTGGFAQGRGRHAERIAGHQRGHFSRFSGLGLVAEVLGLVQERELVGRCSERGMQPGWQVPQRERSS